MEVNSILKVGIKIYRVQVLLAVIRFSSVLLVFHQLCLLNGTEALSIGNFSSLLNATLLGNDTSLGASPTTLNKRNQNSSYLYNPSSLSRRSSEELDDERVISDSGSSNDSQPALGDNSLAAEISFDDQLDDRLIVSEQPIIEGKYKKDAEACWFMSRISEL